MKITVIFDNYPCKEGLTSDWGFSCLIQETEKTILFDTGADGNILLSNMNQLGIDPKIVDIVFLSHEHWDHTGGLSAFLGKNPNCTLYLPKSFGTRFGAKNYKEISNSVEICKDVHSTGELGTWMKEQSLVLKTEKGLVIITGCAHPGIVNILEKVREIFKQKIYLVIGGFHLLDCSDSEIQKIISDFKSLDVKLAGPSHCSGDRAIKLFNREYGDSFVRFGVGRSLSTDCADYTNQEI